jgi:hypothetical protein
MFNTRNTANNNNSNSNIIIILDLILSYIEYQFDNITKGIINVVNNIKYIDIPSIPIYIFIPLNSLISSIN